MNNDELKIEHEAPTLKIEEKQPEPKEETPAPVSEPAPEPIVPEPTLNEQREAEQAAIPILAQPTPVDQPKAKKDKSIKKLVILLSVISSVIILAGVTALLHVLSSKPEPEPTTTTTEEPEEDIEKIKAEDQQIMDDVKSLVVALKQFQDNNDGKIPANWDSFFKKYAPGINQKYKHANVCDFTNQECKHITDMTWEEDKYLIHIATNSSCKKEFILNPESSVHRVTFYTALQTRNGEKPAYFCASNSAWKSN